MLQLLVHLVGFSLKSSDFEFSWGNVPLEVFDLVVKHELEFLELLRLFLELVNVVLSFSNGKILVENFTGLGVNLLSELLDSLILERQLMLLVLDVSGELVDLRL